MGFGAGTAGWREEEPKGLGVLVEAGVWAEGIRKNV
jgi:hypothetical protein